jgi:hypothetical protein
MQTIPIDFDVIKRHYPRRSDKVGEFGGKLEHPDLRAFMAKTPGTPCCVQVSHAFNMAGHLIPPRFDGQRRPPSRIVIGGMSYYYLLAVDEMEKWLTETYGPGELVSHSGKSKRTHSQLSSYLQGRKGLLVIREGPAGVHTEFWTGRTFLQTDMAVAKLLEKPRVLFWDCTLAPPQWLEDYMR